MIVDSRRKALYLDAEAVRVRLDHDALRIGRPRQADQLIPLRRVGRAVVENPGGELLKACLALVRQGGTVHFQGSDGITCAVLQQPLHDGPAWVHDLAELIEHESGCARFHWWQDVQHRHAWSLVFRRSFRGDFQANKARLMRYVEFFRPGVPAWREARWLEQQLTAWLQAEINANGVQPVVRVLAGRGCDLLAALQRCLSVPFLWRYVCWRRLQDGNGIARQNLAQFFELQAAAPLRDQLERHMRALVYEYHAVIRLQDVEDDLEP